MTRAEEVANEIVKNWRESNGESWSQLRSSVYQTLSSLPEFQPGRELTGDDIQNALKSIGCAIFYPAVAGLLAAELNKIRAPKKDHPYSMAAHVQNLQTDKNNLADRCNILTSRISDLEKERDELKAQLESVKSQQVGVTKDQVKAAVLPYVKRFVDLTDDHCTEIAAALSPKWIKCSNQLPTIGQTIYWIDNQTKTPVADVYNCEMFDDPDYWMPRYVPEPPKEEESELVKKIRALGIYADSAQQTRDHIIEIVKEFEKGAKK